MSLTLRIEGFEADRVEKMVADFLAQRADEMLATRLDAEVAKAVAAIVGRDVDIRIQAALDKIIADGWEQTNSYGESTGKKLSLKARVSEMLTRRDGYGDRRNNLDKMFEDTLNAALHKELAEEISAARRRFREQVDAVLQAKLNEALRESLGLGK